MKILRTLPFLLLAHMGLAQTTYTHTLPNIQGSQLSSWVNFSFPNATATTGGGTLSFSWLACWQQVFGGSSKIWVELQTGTSTWTEVYYETGNTQECVSLARNASLSAGVLANAIAVGGGSVNGRVRVQDSCYPGVGCSFYNDPLVNGLTLTYQTHAANFNTADASVCPGGTVSFTDASLNTPSSYEWIFEGGTPATSDQQNPVVQYAATGTYDVTLIVVTIDGPDTLTRSNFVTVYALPAANAGVDEDLCAGGSEGLQASGGTSYQWFPPDGLSNANIANPVASPANTTSYTVLVTDNNGCQASDFMILTVHPLPIVQASAGNNSICLGDTANVVAVGAQLYTWSPNLFISGTSGASVNVWPTSTFTWNVSGTDAFGCANTSTFTITVNPPPAAPVVTNTGMQVTTASAAGYQWLLNGAPISGASQQSWSPAVNGNYSVVITDANGCTAQSLPVYFGSVGSLEQQATTVRVYPQPADERLVVEGLAPGTVLSLVDAAGRTVLYRTAATDRMELDTTELPAGNYVLVTSAAGTVQRTNVVVR